MKRFDLSDWPTLAAGLRQPYQDHYYAMYSSLYDGIVTDPVLMLLPLDDHMVHRGDGVFEALKLVDGRLYNLRAHLERLAQSAQAIALRLPRSLDAIHDLAVETARAGGRRTGTLRIFAARGPGGFSVNPYECPVGQIYVIVTAAGTPFMQAHPAGARVRTSAVPAKVGAMAAIKNCNYVPNVLMKKEAIDAGVDFTIGFDGRGCLTEGATENVGIVARDGRLLFPMPERILAGTTMLRVVELAERLAADGRLAGVAWADIRRADLDAARELILTGTTINVTAAVEFDGRPVGDGTPGPVWQALSDLLEEDIHHNAALLTPVL
jgi:branched-chain amino acid aminotransferase